MGAIFRASRKYLFTRRSSVKRFIVLSAIILSSKLANSDLSNLPKFLCPSALSLRQVFRNPPLEESPCCPRRSASSKSTSSQRKNENVRNRVGLGRRVLARNRRTWRIPNSDWQLINAARRHPRGQLARPRYRNAIFIAGARACEHSDTSTRCIGQICCRATSNLPAIVVIDFGPLPTISLVATFLRDVSRFSFHLLLLSMQPLSHPLSYRHFPRAGNFQTRACRYSCVYDPYRGLCRSPLCRRVILSRQRVRRCV